MTSKNPKFISDFRGQLAKHFIEQQQAVEDGHDLSDNRASHFAELILSLRKEREWTRSYCAKVANLPETTIFSLEKGLILSSDIEPVWCYKLSQLFDVELSEFEAILGRNLALNLTVAQQLLRFNQWSVAFFSSQKRVYVVIGMMSLTLLGWLVNAIYNFWVTSWSISLPKFSLQQFMGLNTTLQITAVSFLLLMVWFFIWQGESIYQWLKPRKEKLMIAAFSILLLILSYQASIILPIYFQCQQGINTLTCINGHILEQIFLLTTLLLFCVAITVLIFTIGRRLIRILHQLQTQRKVVYITLIISLIMPLLFFKSSTVNALRLNTSLELTSSIQNEASLFEMSTYQQLHPQESTALLKKIWSSDQANHLRHKMEWHHEYTAFSLFQFGLTALLYALITITVIKKGQFTSSFSKN